MLATSTSPGFLKFLFENIDSGKEKRKSLSGVLWILLIRFSVIIYFLFLLCPVFWVLSHPLALELNYVLLIDAFCCSCSMPCRTGIKPIGVIKTRPDNKDTGGKNHPLIFHDLDLIHESELLPYVLTEWLAKDIKKVNWRGFRKPTHPCKEKSNTKASSVLYAR